ncbi:MAG: c-type cytochrome [Betaproteobacteria bacterium]
MAPGLRGAAVLVTLALLPPEGKAAADAARGKAVFRAHCIQCHGEKADGRGPLAARFNPPPANIAATTRGDDYLLQIVRRGGEAMGRSSAMPRWELELSGDEILDVVAYLRQVVKENRQRAAATAPAPGGKS